jgi:hypothetical protein
VGRRAIKAAQFSRMTISCDVGGFLPLLQSAPHLTLNTQGSAKPPPWEAVGFEGGFGPKSLVNSAQALAWVALFLRASPVGAPENTGAIHIGRARIQMTISSAPSGLIAFIVTPPRLKPGLSSQGPSGRNRLQSPTGSWADLCDLCVLSRLFCSLDPSWCESFL